MSTVQPFSIQSMVNQTGYVTTRIDIDFDKGEVVNEQTYRFPSRHYYELWASLYPQVNDEAASALWEAYRIEPQIQTYTVNG